MGPAAGDQAAMPADDGGRLHDQEHFPQARPVDGGGQHGEDGAVVLGEARSGDLALQDKDLVAQGEDLGVALVAGGEQPTKAGQDQTRDGREEVHGGGDGIGRRSSRIHSWWPRASLPSGERSVAQAQLERAGPKRRVIGQDDKVGVERQRRGERFCGQHVDRS